MAVKKASADLPRCKWPGSDPLYLGYHDDEWGVPLRDSRALFEMLQLEGAQAGLSWITILRKRENYRRAFDGFDPVKIARYAPAKIEKLMANEGIVRNRLKIEGVVTSAKAYLAMEKQGVSFSDFLWNFVDGEPILNREGLKMVERVLVGQMVLMVRAAQENLADLRQKRKKIVLMHRGFYLKAERRPIEHY